MYIYIYCILMIIIDLIFNFNLHPKVSICFTSYLYIHLPSCSNISSLYIILPTVRLYDYHTFQCFVSPIATDQHKKSINSVSSLLLSSLIYSQS